jgi:hypothetical protein
MSQNGCEDALSYLQTYSMLELMAISNMQPHHK